MLHLQAASSVLPIILFADLRDQRVIGKGAFGEVRSAKRGGVEQVVVKTTRVGAFNKASIAKELGFLRDIPPSSHVARILGVCVDAPDGELGIVMDYCEHGSLASFMKKQRKVRNVCVRVCVCVLCV